MNKAQVPFTAKANSAYLRQNRVAAWLFFIATAQVRCAAKANLHTCARMENTSFDSKNINLKA